MEAMAACFQSDQAFQAEPHVRRRIAYDTQGYIAELLAKAVGKGALDEELNEGDRGKLLDLLTVFGALGSAQDGPQYAYSGSTRPGCTRPEDVYDACDGPARLGLQELLRSEFWRRRFYQSCDYE